MKRALLVLLLAACDPVDFTVAHVPDSGDFAPNPCTDNSDCHGDQFCEKHGCGDTHGDCHQKPLCMGIDEYEPVCGCNGVTYWNDCLRKLDGANFKEMDQCDAAKSCNVASDCSQGPWATCARVSQVSCPTSGAPGVCWATPAVCPGGQSTNAQSCAGGACMDLCSALKSQQPALLKSSCP